MMNYRIWKCNKNDDYLLIEVFNECDIPSIQKSFIEKGYNDRIADDANQTEIGEENIKLINSGTPEERLQHAIFGGKYLKDEDEDA